MGLGQRLEPDEGPLERERLTHARPGRRRRAAPPARLTLATLGGGPLGAPVGTTKSRWRTRTKPQTAPTRATTAPISMRWFRVPENPSGTPAAALAGAGDGMAGARLADLARGHGALELRTAPAQDLGAEGRLGQRGGRVRHNLALEHRAEHGDPGGDADLAEGVVGPRGHATALRLDDGDGARGQHRVDDADPEAAHDEAGQQHGPGRGRMGRRHEQEPAGDEEHPDARTGTATARGRSGARRRRR